MLETLPPPGCSPPAQPSCLAGGAGGRDDAGKSKGRSARRRRALTAKGEQLRARPQPHRDRNQNLSADDPPATEIEVLAGGGPPPAPGLARCGGVRAVRPAAAWCGWARRLAGRTRCRCRPRPRVEPPPACLIALDFGKCSAITGNSASVKSVWHRMTMRLCCCRVVGVHTANPRLVQEPPRNHGGHRYSTFFNGWRSGEPKGG